MILKTAISIVITVFLMSGCSSTVSGTDTNESSGVHSADSGSQLGSLSGTEDTAAFLEEKQWTSISIDLDKYYYDTTGSTQAYTMEMDFVDGTVNALADCYLISASYRVVDSEIQFSKVSSPKPDIYNATCKEFEDAENAVDAFFSSNYIVSSSTTNTIVLEATDVDTSVTLKR